MRFTDHLLNHKAMIQENPFIQINDRFDQIESMIHEIKSKVEYQTSINPLERLTRKEIQSEFKVSLSTIHKLMRLGSLDYSKVGRKTLFCREDVEKCFNKKGG